MPDLDDPLVDKWEQWYVSRPDYVARMVDRSRRYLYHIVIEVEKRRMPIEIALLPMVESAFNPNAMSVARASGIWQFMPSTGKHYGLKQNFWFDSRRDVVAATDKALDYLQKLHGDFDDWQLALAGYNWGEGNVGRAVAKNQKLRLPADYANLKMPDETRNYLPKLQAVKNIVRDPEKYGARSRRHPRRAVFRGRQDGPQDRRENGGRSSPRCRSTSSCYSIRSTTVRSSPAPTSYSILLPIDKAEIFAAKLQLTDQPLVSWQAYRLHNGETLPQVAAKFGLRGRDAARGERHRRASESPRRAHAARADAGADRGRRRDAVEGRVHDGAAGSHVLLPRPARRHARRRRGPLRGVTGGHQALERSHAELGRGRKDAAHHERSRARRPAR